ncbi:MAG: bifunctional adenosylcobinamide kinase/adenosylcobinamide-phosphate guanylyltransferase [Deltaproteobacteria bacterium]|nr:bifunctional adenosylcobinamide kinase/adenosylcobinamide-phosphate guanylyltransferase [Deltaproteobacteria bacterium]
MMIFVTGGARSGKSTFAQNLGETLSGKRLFVATAEAFDEEMERRIQRHRKQRGDRWDTREEPIDLGEAISSARGEYGTVLVDCLTVWMSNLMHRYGGQDEAASRIIDDLFRGLEGFPGTVIVVSNEVGMGIVPDNKLARDYRDRLGFLNQRTARAADEVYLLCSGIPVKIK